MLGLDDLCVDGEADFISDGFDFAGCQLTHAVCKADEQSQVGDSVNAAWDSAREFVDFVQCGFVEWRHFHAGDFEAMTYVLGCFFTT